MSEQPYSYTPESSSTTGGGRVWRVRNNQTDVVASFDQEWQAIQVTQLLNGAYGLGKKAAANEAATIFQRGKEAGAADARKVFTMKEKFYDETLIVARHLVNQLQGLLDD
jgi:hypothetical protein